MVIQPNKVYCGDCLDVLYCLDKNSIDLTITSPPYDDLREYKGYFLDFENIAKELFKVTKQGGIAVWVVGDRTQKGDESGTSFRQALYFKEIGFNLFDTMIYKKPPRGAIGSNKSYYDSFEYMFILSKGVPKTINLIKDRKNKESRKGDNGTRRLRNGEMKHVKRGGYGEFGRRTNVWEYNIGRGQSTKDEIAFQHPAIFPEKLAEDHIISWSNENDLILDPMCGSGTVLKMAKKNGRKYIGIDISEEYCKLSEERINLLQ